MKTRMMIAIAALALSSVGVATAADQDVTYGKRVNTVEQVASSRTGSYDVYIDAPTGFAFVNTINGWKFTRKVSAAVPAAEQTAKMKVAEL